MTPRWYDWCTMPVVSPKGRPVWHQAAPHMPSFGNEQHLEGTLETFGKLTLCRKQATSVLSKSVFLQVSYIYQSLLFCRFIHGKRAYRFLRNWLIGKTSTYILCLKKSTYSSPGVWNPPSRKDNTYMIKSYLLISWGYLIIIIVVGVGIHVCNTSSYVQRMFIIGILRFRYTSSMWRIAATYFMGKIWNHENLL